MALSVHEDMNHIAVGFGDGTVIVIFGNIILDKTTKLRAVHSESAPGVHITGQSVDIRTYMYMYIIMCT